MNDEYQSFETEHTEQEPQAEQPEQQPAHSEPEVHQYNPYQQYQYHYNPNPTPQPPVQHKKEPKKKRWGLRVAVVALCCALVGSAAGGAIVGSVMHNIYKNDTSMSQQPSASQPAATPSESTSQVVQTRQPSSGQLTPAEIYAQNVSTVVSISNEATTNVFGQVTATASSGTGFVISADGEILTNYHVVKNASKLTVTMNSGESYNATVIGYEEDNDVALIKIDATGLTPVSLGKSSDLRVGDEVAAIGNPLGELTNTMTVGYVSALDRYINTDGSPINMMQIDAAINSGNSGGPLFDMNGNVVGITTAKYSGTTNSGTTIEGIGFAIPIDDVTSILDDLRTNGRVTNRAYIGITASNVSSSDSENYGFPQGVLVNSVESGSCGEKAGLRRYDIITGIDNTTIKSLDELSAALKSYRAGDTATLEVYRSGKTMQMTVTFDEKPQTTTTASDNSAQQPSENQQGGQQDDQQSGGSSGWGFPWNILP